MSRLHFIIAFACALLISAISTRAESLEDLRAQQRFARERFNDYAKKADELNFTLKDPDLPDNAEAERRIYKARLEAQSQDLLELKKRLQFKLRDLTQDLRDKAIKLSIDGMGLPGRLSTSELELSEQIKQQVTLQRDLDKINAENDQILATAEPAKPNAQLAELGQRKAVLGKQLAKLNDEINHAKADFGDMTYALKQYLRSEEEERDSRQLLRQTNDKLDAITMQQLSKTNPPATHNKELLKKQLTALDLIQDDYRARLKDLDTQIEKLHQSQAAATFPGTVDVFLSPAELANNKPTITAAHLDKTIEINGKNLVQLTNNTNTWTLDPTQIIAIRSQK